MLFILNGDQNRLLGIFVTYVRQELPTTYYRYIQSASYLSNGVVGMLATD